MEKELIFDEGVKFEILFQGTKHIVKLYELETEYGYQIFAEIGSNVYYFGSNGGLDIATAISSFEEFYGVELDVEDYANQILNYLDKDNENQTTNK